MRYRRALAAASLLALLATVASAASLDVIPIVRDSKGQPVPLLAAETVNATATIASDAVPLATARALSLHWQCTSSSGTPKVDVIWRSSPTRESTDYVDDYVIAVDSVSEEKLIRPIYATPSYYGQLAITGKTGNPADTVCSATLYIQGR